ncbi:MAG: cupin domain-containing protein [Candidatus Cloacimonetes bacterium]|nr:cupin domain-containing protein [Candidatus Cloacimonadota bacterium]
MIIKNYIDISVNPNPHGIESKQLHNSEHAVIMHLLLMKGEALKLHVTPVDVVFYVLEGKPSITVGDETIQVSKDSLVESPKDIPHTIANNTDETVRVLVIKTPRPIQKTTILNQ